MATTTATPITQEQIDRCDRIIDSATNTVFYQVRSESDDTKVYQVRYNATYKRLTCTCKAGESGYFCKHRRWALAAEDEYKTLLAAERQAEARIAEASKTVEETAEQAQIEAWVRQGVERDVATRVAYAQPAPVGNAKPFQAKAFSLLA